MSTSWGGVVKRAYPELAGDSDTDVVIVGGGISGVMAAYFLSKADIDVVLLEKNEIGSGATGLTTAFITEYIDTEAANLKKMFGEDSARSVYESHNDAIETLSGIVGKEQIDCEFERVSEYIVALTTKEAEELLKEVEALRGLGVDVEYKTDDTLGFENVAYAEIVDQAKFHPLKFLYGMVERLRLRGVSIHEKTEAIDIKGGDDGVRVTTSRGTVRALHGISAAYWPFNKPAGLHFKKGTYTTYMFELLIPKGKIPVGIYEDMKNPYHYFRIDTAHGVDRMIVGGEDHRSDIPVDPEKNFKALQSFVDSTFAGMKYEIARKWKGPIIESVDGLATMGPIKSDRIIYSTGFSGNGMTYAVIFGHIASDMVLGKENKWEKLYRADRTPSIRALARKGRDYTEELVKGAVKNAIKWRSK